MFGIEVGVVAVVRSQGSMKNICFITQTFDVAVSQHVTEIGDFVVVVLNFTVLVTTLVIEVLSKVVADFDESSDLIVD